MSQSQLPLLHDHLLLYAKGHYMWGNPLNDLKRIFRACREPDDIDHIINSLITPCYFAIISAEDAVIEFAELMKFLYSGIGDATKQVNMMDVFGDEEKMKPVFRDTMILATLYSMLMILARTIVDRELQKPMPSILDVTDDIFAERAKARKWRYGR